MTAPPILFAAHGDRARSWADAVRRSRDLELLAAIDLSAGGIEGLDSALRARPDAAAMMWSAGPLESTSLAERLAEHEGPTLLHPAPARPPLGAGVQVTHGWLSLSGVAAIERLFASAGATKPEIVRLRARGVPEGPGLGLSPALYHALTLAHRFGQRVSVERAVLDDEQHLTLALEVDGVPWRVEVFAKKGPELQLVVRTSGGDFTWSADAVSESLERSSAEPRALPAASWAERCLRQITSPLPGADLADARAVSRTLDAVELALERRLPPTPFPRATPAPERAASAASAPELSGSFRISIPELSGSFRISVEALEADALTRLGLRGELPDAATHALAPPPSPAALPIEVIAYRLDLRPAATLTIDPQDEEKVRALLPGAIERREHEGARKIELFAARDAAAARRLAELSAEDAEGSASSLGAILGYPACCVQAFVAQIDHDESYDRYAIAARTSFGPGPWPALLDDTSLKVLPHQPCTYRCEGSREQARALHAVLAVEEPRLHAALTDYLGGPVLYFDHDHQLRFRGAVSEGGIAYDEVSMPFAGSAPFAQLAGAIAAGDRLVLSEGALTVFARDAPLFTLERTDPGLGLILPFAPA